MEHSGFREPSAAQFKRTVPREAISLAPATQSAPPQSQQSFSEPREAVEVSWYRVIVEVTLHDRLEPSSRLSYGIMHAPLELLLKLPQFGPHALADRFASHGVAPQTILPANVRESRPGESHPEPLAEPDMNLSAHPAPIKQTLRSYRYPSVRREPFVPRQAVVETGSPGPYGL